MNEQNTVMEAGARTGGRVVVEVGTPYLEPGRTRVEVLPDGQVLVSNQLEDETRQAEGKIDPARISRLVDDAADEVARRRLTDRPGLPDEPRYHIEVDRDRQQIIVADVWRSDLQSIPGVARLIRELEAAAKEVSDGQFIL